MDKDFTLPDLSVIDSIADQTSSIEKSLREIQQDSIWEKIEEQEKQWKDTIEKSGIQSCLQDISPTKLTMPAPPIAPFVPYESPAQVLLQEISEELHELKQHQALAQLENRGYSDSARIVFDIVKVKPTNPSEERRIAVSDYCQHCSDAYLEYGLSQLKVSGIIWKYTYCENGDFLIWFSERGIELVGSQNPLGEKKSQLEAAALLLMREYPGFERDFHILINKQYMKVEDGKLVWLKSKICLAEYFGTFGSGTKWSAIEKAFHLSNLKASFHNSLNKSSDFSRLEELLQTYPR